MKSVRIQNDSGVVHDTKITETESGATIHGATGVRLDFVVGEPVRATIDLAFLPVDTVAEGKFVGVNPKTGEMKEIKSIEFADGEKVEL